MIAVAKRVERWTRKFPDEKPVIETLQRIGEQSGLANLVVSDHYEPDPDDVYPGFRFFYLAEVVPGKLFGLIPRHRHRVLVSMNREWNMVEGDTIGCTVLERAVERIAREAVDTLASLIKGKPTVITDWDPLFL